MNLSFSAFMDLLLKEATNFLNFIFLQIYSFCLYIFKKHYQNDKRRKKWITTIQVQLSYELVSHPIGLFYFLKKMFKRLPHYRSLLLELQRHLVEQPFTFSYYYREGIYSQECWIIFSTRTRSQILFGKQKWPLFV